LLRATAAPLCALCRRPPRAAAAHRQGARAGAGAAGGGAPARTAASSGCERLRPAWRGDLAFVQPAMAVARHERSCRAGGKFPGGQRRFPGGRNRPPPSQSLHLRLRGGAADSSPGRAAPCRVRASARRHPAPGRSARSTRRRGGRPAAGVATGAVGATPGRGVRRNRGAAPPRRHAFDLFHDLEDFRLRPAQPGDARLPGCGFARDGGQLLAAVRPGYLRSSWRRGLSFRAAKRPGFSHASSGRFYAVELQDGRRAAGVFRLERGAECEVEIGAAFVQTHDVQPAAVGSKPRRS
jgi:hypothetical protein